MRRAASTILFSTVIALVGLSPACDSEVSDTVAGTGGAGATAGNQAGTAGDANGGEGGMGGFGGVGGVGGGTSGTGGPPIAVACPDAPVTAGTTCTPRAPNPNPDLPDYAHCTWGDDVRFECRQGATCTSAGVWEVTLPPSGGAPAHCSGQSAFPSTCAASPPQNGEACAANTPRCYYEDGTKCACRRCEWVAPFEPSDCDAIPDPYWDCATPQAGCPATIPNAGTPCTNAGQICGIGSFGPECLFQAHCDGSEWIWRVNSLLGRLRHHDSHANIPLSARLTQHTRLTSQPTHSPTERDALLGLLVGRLVGK